MGARQLNDIQKRKLREAGIFKQWKAALEREKKAVEKQWVKTGAIADKKDIRAEKREHLNEVALRRLKKVEPYASVLNRRANAKKDDLNPRVEGPDEPDDDYAPTEKKKPPPQQFDPDAPLGSMEPLSEEQLVWLFHALSTDGITTFPTPGVKGMWLYYMNPDYAQARARFYESLAKRVQTMERHRAIEIHGDHIIQQCVKLADFRERAERMAG